MSEFTDVLDALEATLAAGESFALATIVATSGSTYRRAGARMVIRADGSTVGSLSGGCVEAELQALAAEFTSGGGARTVRIDHSAAHDEHLGWGMGCRGIVEVLVEPPRTAVVVADAMRASLYAPVVVSTDPATGDHAIGEARPGWFVETMEPPPSLLVCGEGPEAEPLARAARALGWESAVIPAAQRFPVITRRTFALVCSHNFEKDAAFLRTLLVSPAAYVGLLGPRSRAELMLQELEGDISRVHAPAGLDIGAETPDEIALSVIAEMQGVLRSRPGGSLRRREGPIHPPGSDHTRG